MTMHTKRAPTQSRAKSTPDALDPQVLRELATYGESWHLEQLHDAIVNLRYSRSVGDADEIDLWTRLVQSHRRQVKHCRNWLRLDRELAYLAFASHARFEEEALPIVYLRDGEWVS